MARPIGPNFTFEPNDFTKISSGSYATVYRGLNTTTKETVAVKVIDLNRFPLGSRERRYLEQETAIMKRISHPNVVKLLYSEEQGRYLYLVLEYVGGGDLRKFIESNGPLSEPVARKFLCQMSIGLKYLHEHGIIHRDLKPHNLLLTNRTAQAELKIADFGFARYATDMMESILGSPLYMAPEMIRRERYNSKSDLWSVGVIFYEMLTGRTPFHDARTQVELATMIETKSIMFPQGTSKLCRDILSGLLQKKPKQRLDWEQFFGHQFLLPGMSESSILENQDTWLQPVLCFDNHGREVNLFVTTKTLISDIKRLLQGELRVPVADQLMLDSDGVELADNATLESYKFNLQSTGQKCMYNISRKWLLSGQAEAMLSANADESMYPLTNNVERPKAPSRNFSQVIQSVASSNPHGTVESRLAEYENLFKEYDERLKSLYVVSKVILEEGVSCLKSHDAQMKVYKVLRTYMILRGGKLTESLAPILELFNLQEKRISKVVDMFENTLKVMKATMIDPAIATDRRALLDCIDEKAARESYSILAASFSAIKKDITEANSTSENAPKQIELALTRNMDASAHKQMYKLLEEGKNVMVSQKERYHTFLKQWRDEKDRISMLRLSITSSATAEKEKALIERLLALEQVYTQIDQGTTNLFNSLRSCIRNKLLLERELFRGLHALADPHEAIQKSLHVISTRVRPALTEALRRAVEIDEWVLCIPSVYAESLSELKRRRTWTREVSKRLELANNYFAQALQTEYGKRAAFVATLGQQPPTIVGMLFPQLLPSASNAPMVRIDVANIDSSQFPAVSDASNLILEDDFSMILDNDSDLTRKISDLERENAKLKADMDRQAASRLQESKEAQLVAGFRRVDELEAQLATFQQTFASMEQELNVLREERRTYQKPAAANVDVLDVVKERNDLLSQLNTLQACCNTLQTENHRLETALANAPVAQPAVQPIAQPAVQAVSAENVRLKAELQEAHNLIQQLLNAQSQAGQ